MTDAGFVRCSTARFFAEQATIPLRPESPHSLVAEGRSWQAMAEESEESTLTIRVTPSGWQCCDGEDNQDGERGYSGEFTPQVWSAILVRRSRDQRTPKTCLAQGRRNGLGKD